MLKNLFRKPPLIMKLFRKRYDIVQWRNSTNVQKANILQAFFVTWFNKPLELLNHQLSRSRGSKDIKNFAFISSVLQTEQLL
jgi:hypothetical protein